MTTKTIKVNYLARVEGEGAMFVEIKDNEVKEVKLKIFEPPRFFEALLRDKKYSEAPDITARICGICPVAYQMSAVHAMELAFGITVSDPIRELRRLLYCGEWIQSHILHMYMLHAPDFLGYPDAIQMAKDHPSHVERGLKLKRIGNDLMNLVGGRNIHPINVKVGGFYKIPKQKEFQNLLEDLKWGRDEALATINWMKDFEYPEFSREYHFVSLYHDKEYPLNEGKLVSNQGLDISVADYEKHFEEIHVKHSTALHSVYHENGIYFVGPMARYNNCFDKLPDEIRSIALQSGLEKTCTNPFQSILVRAIEVLYAFDEAIRIIENLNFPIVPAVDIEAKEGVGYACTEAPRGILFHRYEITKDGKIKEAKIVPPTSQNQKVIEDDMYHFVDLYKSLSQEELTHKCEHIIRNYDPCISCSTHFLNLELKRD